MDKIMEMLPVILPLAIVQIGLGIFAAVHAAKHPNYKFGNKPMWIAVCLLVSILGPVLYFAVGKGEDE